MSTQTKGTRRSRSGGVTPPEKRILVAGRKLFFSEGFSVVSTERLAKEASVSKTSIYKYFGDMTGVFKAVVEQDGQAFMAGVRAQTGQTEDFWSGVVTYGENLIQLLRRCEIVQFDRMIHEEARKQPAIAEVYFQSTYGQTHEQLIYLLQDGQKHGHLPKDLEVGDMADHLICMWEGLSFVKRRLGLQDVMKRSPRHWSRHCVETLFGLKLSV